MIKVKAEDIRKEFPAKSGSARSVALDGINLEIRDAEFFAIVGPSGCGKSTFLEIVAGLIKSTSGSTNIFGAHITGPDHNRGVVFQGYVLFPWRTVIGNVVWIHTSISLQRAFTGFALAVITLILSATHSILVLVAAEMIGMTSGLGYSIKNWEFNFMIPEMYAAIVVLAVLGLITNYSFVWIEKKAVKWKEEI